MNSPDSTSEASSARAAVLLVMTAQADEAERLIKPLRDAGLAVRGMYSPRAERVKRLVERRACDVIICCAYDPAVDLNAVLDRHRELTADVPLIVIAEREAMTETLAKVMHSRARDCTERDDHYRLALVIRRELADLRARRQARRLTRRIREMEQVSPGGGGLGLDPQTLAALADVGGGGSREAPGLTALFAAIAEAQDRAGASGAPVAVFHLRVRGTPALYQEMGLTRGRALIGTLAIPLRRLVVDSRGLVARVSDDSFGLLVPGMDEAAAAALAARIRSEVRVPQAAGTAAAEDGEWDIGFALGQGLAKTAAELFDDAWRASRDLETGHAEELPSTSLAARSKQVQDRESDPVKEKVEWSLAHDRLLLVYQPIISLLGDRQENYSVLLRLIDNEENLLEAKEFIEAAIQDGRIEELDKWVLRTALAVLSERREAGLRINFFVNLAEDTFRNPSFLVWLCDSMREFNVRGNWLTFVIQEELVDDNLGSLTRLVGSLKKLKCRVGINRFGAVEEPQRLLQAFPLDFVLLRPDLTLGLANDQDKQQRLQGLASLAREFNVKSVATGVEDAHTLTILWSAGVDYVQGNFLQRPSPTLEIGTAEV